MVAMVSLRPRANTCANVLEGFGYTSYVRPDSSGNATSLRHAVNAAY